MKASFQGIHKSVKKIAGNWQRHSNDREAAAIAFYTIFSLAPTLVIGVFVASFIIGETSAKYHIIEEVRILIGAQGANAVKSILDNITNIKQGVMASAISIIILLYGASKVFAEMRYAFNRIFDVKAKESTKHQFFAIIKARLLGFAVVLSVGFFLLVSLVISAVLTALSEWVVEYSPVDVSNIAKTNFLLTIILISLIFALLIKFLPEKKILWRHIWPGAILSGIIFTLGKDLIGYYLGKSGISSAYGAAGSLIIILIWIYFSVQILILGAEITNVISTRKKE